MKLHKLDGERINMSFYGIEDFERIFLLRMEAYGICEDYWQKG